MSQMKLRAARYAKSLIAEFSGDYMAEQNIAAIHDKISDIALKAEELSKLDYRYPDWLEDKISKVADDIEEIHSYLKTKGAKELMKHSDD